MKKAIVLISHGSRSAQTKVEVESMVNQLKVKLTGAIFTFGFLELEHPSIPEAIDEAVMQGANEIIILLNFLNSGRHVDSDIPQIIDEARGKYPHIKFKISKPISQHPHLIDIFVDLSSAV